VETFLFSVLVATVMTELQIFWILNLYPTNWINEAAYQ